jgi:hypothetical protein
MLEAEAKVKVKVEEKRVLRCCSRREKMPEVRG